MKQVLNNVLKIKNALDTDELVCVFDQSLLVKLATKHMEARRNVQADCTHEQCIPHTMQVISIIGK